MEKERESVLFPAVYIRRAMEMGRLSHAYLLLGRVGSGKRRFAGELARALFCEGARESAADGEGGAGAHLGFCGRCASCRTIEHGNHPGVTVYGPAEGKTVIDIDTVREVSARSHYARDHAFVAILEGVDQLTLPAANALLKTLEEPPAGFILLLTAASAGAVIPTIVSRCHRLYFPAVTQSWGGDKVDLEALEEACALGFFSRHDVPAWLSKVIPADLGARGRVRELTDLLIHRYRDELGACAGGAGLDDLLERLETTLELRTALDANVSPDLVLERALNSVLGAGP